MKPGAVFFWTHHNRLNMTIQSLIYFRMKSGESVRLFDANRCLSNIVSCDYRTDDEELNQKIYKIANDAVYMFSASEMDVRLKLTLNVVRRMSADELSVSLEIDSMKDGFIARIIVDTDEINGVSYMQKIVDNVNNVFDKSIMLGYAIVGLYLKKVDCYENSILNEEFLSDCFKTISMNILPTNEMIDVIFDVGDMLEKILWKYEKRLYDAIFTELCERGVSCDLINKIIFLLYNKLTINTFNYDQQKSITNKRCLTFRAFMLLPSRKSSSKDICEIFG